MKYLTGIRPTGRLHLGNYLGAIKHGRELGATFFIADLHGQGDVGSCLKQLDKLNIKAEIESNYYPAILRLQHIISQYVGVGRLERMTQYKDKSETEQATLKLLSYPVLMAADIFYFGGTHIPVGADQVQHIEFARDMVDILAYNGIYYTKPEAVLSEYPRIMSLTDGNKKMSKSSCDDAGIIYVDDTPEVIRRKILSAKTAMTMGDVTPEMLNLKTIYKAVGGNKNHSRFKEFKEELAELLIKEFSV
jgi:tryptophanyl-tRNA synthetase